MPAGAGAVAPVDRRGEVARRRIRVGVGEGRHRLVPVIACLRCRVIVVPLAVSAASATVRVARCARRAAADVLDGRADRVLALVGIGVRAIDRKAAAALRDDRAGRGRAVAPIDRCREVARRRIRIGVGEGRNRRAADRCALGAADSRAAGGERGVGDRRAAGGGRCAAADVVDGDADRVLALVGIGVRAVDGEAAAVLRDDRAGRGRAVAPIDRRREVAGRRIRVGVGEGGNRRGAGRSQPLGAADRHAGSGQRCVGDVAVLVAVAVLPPTSLMVTPTAYLPSSA